MKVIAWNMNARVGNWSPFLPGGELRCDIALLNEACTPPADLAENVLMNESTIGRDDKSLGFNKTRNWAAAVFAPHELSHPEDVWSLPPREGDRRSPLSASKPGSWSAAAVDVHDFGRVTAISLYGLLDERSDASVHRSLSDLTPLLEDKRYNELLVLGGDLNALAAAPAGTTRLARDQGVLDRITEGFGLVDLLRASLREHHPDRGGLAGCQCGLGSDCQHTWTFRSEESSTTAHQDDYLFASPKLFKRMERCVALSFTDTSDHTPIEATFN